MLLKNRCLLKTKYLLGFILFFCITLVQTGLIQVVAGTRKSNATSAQVQTDKNSKTSSNESRISYVCNHLYISQETVIHITLKDRTKEEDLTVVSDDEDILRVQSGKWRGDEKTLLLVPKKAGTVQLGISLKKDDSKGNHKEELMLTVQVKDQRELSSGEIYENSKEAMVEIVTYDSVNARDLGSGFFISENEILTNYHVIQDSSKLYVRDYAGKDYTVTHIVDYDITHDLAILQVKEESKHALILNTKKVSTGEVVYALGSPLELTGTLSEGMISKAYRQYENITYHQSTAYLSKSSGGGPLLNHFGEVIGVNTLMILGNQNIYLAVDIEYISFLDRKNPKPIKVLYEENEGKVSKQIIYITIP